MHTNMSVFDEEYDDIIGSNAEMTQLVLKSKLIEVEELNKCHRIIEKTRLKGEKPAHLLDLLYQKQLISEDQKKALSKAAERISRDKETAKFRISGYRLVNKIGTGGLGVVYQARQLSMKRIVAIKILHENWAKDEEFRSRFLREARVMGRLSHQNLIQVFDVGLKEKNYYFSMEYIDGPTVEDMVEKNGALSAIEALDITIQVARAINYISSYDIVHRDIKPANLMMTKTGIVKLGDFGFLYVKHEKALSPDGYVIGTPDYISPEQASGGYIDFRSDLYSLGVCLYQMLTGNLPYSGSVSTVMRKHVVADLPERVPETGSPIPPEIYSVICKLMAKDPADRYQDVNELLEDLQYYKAAEIMKKDPRNTLEMNQKQIPQLPHHSTANETNEEVQNIYLEKQNKNLFIMLLAAFSIIVIQMIWIMFNNLG